MSIGNENILKIALIQLTVIDDKLENVRRAVLKIDEAAANGAKLIVLPEFFNAPIGEAGARSNCEIILGPSADLLSNAAKRNEVYLIAGSMPELENGKIFNTCPIFNPQGNLIGKYRKIHLFDIDLAEKLKYLETQFLSPGEQPVIIHIGPFKIGLGICHDLRFNELSQLYVKFGCNVLIFPSAFTVSTGELYWELLARSQAFNNQCYACLCSPSRHSNGSYTIYGHSIIADPWGSKLAAANEDETIIYADLDIQRINQVRRAIPILNQSRNDIYDIIAKIKPKILT